MGLPRLRFPFFNQGCCRRRCCCLLSLLLSFLNQPKYAWVPHLRRGFMRLRWECTNSPRQLLPLLLFLFLRLLDLFQPHNKRHLDRRRRTLPPQWRDPCISSLPLPLPLPLSLPLPLLLFLPLLLLLQLLVLRRHSERSEEPPHFPGERSDPSAFLFPHPNTVISTAAEKPASLPIPPSNPYRAVAVVCPPQNPYPHEEKRKGTPSGGAQKTNRAKG